MKILHITQMIGGLDVYVGNAIIYSGEEHEFVIVHGKEDRSEVLSRENSCVKEYKVDLYRKINLFNDFLCLLQVVKIIKREEPEVIHCHSAKGGVVGRIAGWITRKKTYYTPHAFSFLSANKGYKRKLYLFLERICKLNSYLLACSESEREIGLNEVGYKVDRALVWRNSVPMPRFIDDFSLDYKCPFICYIGRPSYQKNTLFLIDVVKKVTEKKPGIKFVLLGVGHYSPLLEVVKKKILELDLEDVVELVPWLEHEETMSYLNKSLFYLTVAKYEGLPLAVVEAMALGKAIVASDVVGNRDCVIDGYNGRLIKEDDVSEFSKTICYLIDNEECRNLYEVNSKIMFRDSFDIANRISLLYEIYKKK